MAKQSHANVMISSFTLLINLGGILIPSIAQTATPPQPTTGNLTFVNQCAYPVTIMSSTNPSMNGTTLSRYSKQAGAAQYTVALTNLNANAPNNFMFAARTSALQCKALNCQKWTSAALNPNNTNPPPQREGYMLLSPYQKYARFCQQSNAAVSQCTKGGNGNPCCGPNETLDATFGTLFEITPFGGSSNNQDFPDISTNFGTSPTDPPCQGSGPKCVGVNANIFFSVPIGMTSLNTCSFTSKGTPRTYLNCLTASCSDAYQTPEDDKQMTCPSSSAGYQVTLCPS